MTQTAVRENAASTVKQGHAPLAIRFEPVIEMTNELFEQFCALNDDLRIELTAEGMIEIMAPTKAGTGNRNIKISAALENTIAAGFRFVRRFYAAQWRGALPRCILG